MGIQALGAFATVPRPSEGDITGVGCRHLSGPGSLQQSPAAKQGSFPLRKSGRKGDRSKGRVGFASLP